MPTYTAISMADHGGYPDGYDLDFTTDATTGEINLRMVYDAEVVAQRQRQHIETYNGEWFLNRDVGVEWFEYVYVSPFNLGIAEYILKEAMLNVPGTEEIFEFDVSVDYITRGLRVNKAVIKTIFDENIDISGANYLRSL